MTAKQPGGQPAGLKRLYIAENTIGIRMIKRFWIGFIKAIVEMIRKLLARRELERTRDAQADNDARDRGDADDIARRLRGDDPADRR